MEIGPAADGLPRPAMLAPPLETKKTLSERLKERWFDDADHPYCHFEREIERQLEPQHVLLEVGCGRRAELVRRFAGRAADLVGLDLVAPDQDVAAGLAGGTVRLVRGDVAATGLPDASVDLMISRALMEHVREPQPVFDEVRRVLKPGGKYVFLAPNLCDYGALLAKLVPNRLHPTIVRWTEGRDARDTFPAWFRCNTRRALRRLCARSGLELASLRYLGQYPAYFLFNPLLFTLASAYEKLISRFEALGFLRGWILVVIKKPAE